MDLIGILEHLFDKLKVDPTKHKVPKKLHQNHFAFVGHSQAPVLLAMGHFQVEPETGSEVSRVALWDRFGEASFIRQFRNEKKTGPS